MTKFDVRVRKIDLDGQWQEWLTVIDAPDRPAALAKLLRRRSEAEYLLEDGRYRFKVEPHDQDAR